MERMMAGVRKKIADLQGPVGQKAGFGSASAEPLPAGAAPQVIVSGPDTAKSFTFRIPAGTPGLPGLDAVPANEGVASYLTLPGAARDAADARIGVAAQRPFANSVVIIGSSLEEQNGQGASSLDVVGGGALRARGWFHWANGFLGNALQLVHNAGIGGNRYDQMLERFDADVLTRPSAWVGIGSATNSVTAGHSTATITGQLDQMIAKAQAAGRRVFVATVPPRVNINTPALRQVQSEVNDYIRSLASNGRGVVPIDFYTPLLDGATGATVAATTTDGTHFSIAGAARLGRVVADALRPFVIPATPRPSSLVDPFSVIGNPLIDSTGWTTLTGSGTPTYVPAVAAPGVTAKISITGNTSVSAIRGIQYVEQISAGRFAVGDVIQAQVLVRWSNLVPLSGVATDCVPHLDVRHMTGATTSYTQMALHSAQSEWLTDHSPMPRSGSMVLQTWRQTIASGVDSLQVLLGFKGAASVDLEFELLSVRKGA